MLYELWDYFDVWGNEIEGWEVNNLCKMEDNVFIADNATDHDIFVGLVNMGYLSEKCEDAIYIDNSCGPDFIEIFLKDDMYPFYSLRAKIA